MGMAGKDIDVPELVLWGSGDDGGSLASPSVLRSVFLFMMTCGLLACLMRCAMGARRNMCLEKQEKAH